MQKDINQLHSRRTIDKPQKHPIKFLPDIRNQSAYEWCLQNRKKMERIERRKNLPRWKFLHGSFFGFIVSPNFWRAPFLLFLKLESNPHYWLLVSTNAFLASCSALAGQHTQPDGQAMGRTPTAIHFIRVSTQTRLAMIYLSSTWVPIPGFFVPPVAILLSVRDTYNPQVSQIF